jgi:predicted ABC-type ATPase
MQQPKLILIGGANGSGKTTLARELVKVEGRSYLGADQIAYELNAAQPAAVAIETARQFSQRLDAGAKMGCSSIAAV